MYVHSRVSVSASPAEAEAATAEAIAVFAVCHHNLINSRTARAFYSETLAQYQSQQPVQTKRIQSHPIQSGPNPVTLCPPEH